MKTWMTAPWVALSLGLTLTLPLTATGQPADTPRPRATLPAFESEADLQAFLAPLAEARREMLEAQRRRDEEARRAAEAQRQRDEAARQAWEQANPGKPFPEPPPPPMPMPAPAAAMLESVQVTGGQATSITNNQTAGVDEGGIVKLHGQHLVVLRRGRLFTVDVSARTLRPVSSIDAQAPGMPAYDTWIDEMLIAGDTIAVIGYSYARGGTEVGLFHIDDAGQLSYRSTLHLRSNDYYSARNYASRLVGQQLIFYTPIPLTPWRDLADQLPAFRRWTGDAKAPFERIGLATRLYRHVETPDRQRGITLHTVVSCDLSAAEPSCQATGVFGPASRVFYVSANAVYVLTAPHTTAGEAAAPASLYRLPLDGAPPQVLGVAGRPIDQFSFLEADGQLNLLLRDYGRGGDGMWQAEFNGSSRGLSLLRVPLSDFSGGDAQAAPERYRALPPLSTDQCSLQNRFIGSHLLYGSGCSWRPAKASSDATVNVVAYATPKQPVAQLALDHGADRLEAMGEDAVVIGSKGNELVFSALALGRRGGPALAGRYVQAQASQAETRSHGFFYRALGEHEGLIGLPLRSGGEAGYQQLVKGSTSLLYLRNDHLRMTPVGQLAAQPPNGDDRCRISCVDWYGNARPIFLGDRVFALMGYELVEGRVLRRGSQDRLVELRRVSFQPGG